LQHISVKFFSFFFNKIGRSSSRRYMQRLEVEAHFAIFDPPEYILCKSDDYEKWRLQWRLNL
jgi:hypothetical protein